MTESATQATPRSSTCKPGVTQSPDHHFEPQPPAELTRDALKQLRQATRVAFIKTKTPDSRRPVTRAFRRRKARISNVTDFLSRCTQAELRAVKAFAKHGGPDLLDVRGQRVPAVASSLDSMSLSRADGRHANRRLQYLREPDATSDPSKRWSTLGSYVPEFEQLLTDSKMYPDRYRGPDGQLQPPPLNLGDLKEVLARRRDSVNSLHCPEDVLEVFQSANHALTEKAVSVKVVPVLLGKQLAIVPYEQGVLFNNFASMTQSQGAMAKPHLYYGAQPEALDKPVREKLGRFIQPSRKANRPCLPNFFLEVKSIPASTYSHVRHYGALGARAMHTLQAYGAAAPTYDGKAYTITAIYHNGILRIFAHHPEHADGSDTAYYMTSLGSWILNEDRDQALKGIAAFRNAIHWAKEQRDIAIAAANATAQRMLKRPEQANDQVIDNNEDYIQPHCSIACH